MEKRSERFFVTFVSCPVPFTYIPPTGNERGRKPIAMYVIAGHSRRWPDAAWGKRPMAWASARCGLGQAPYGLGKRPMRPRQAHCQQLGIRPVTLRRISQHPPVTSKLGLSSRLALPAHFHRQPGFLMCGLLIIPKNYWK